MYRVDALNDSAEVAQNKLFNNIQICRVDIACMTGSKNAFSIDSDTVKVAEALAREIKSLIKEEV